MEEKDFDFAWFTLFGRMKPETVIRRLSYRYGAQWVQTGYIEHSIYQEIDRVVEIVSATTEERIALRAHLLFHTETVAARIHDTAKALEYEQSILLHKTVPKDAWKRWVPRGGAVGICWYPVPKVQIDHERWSDWRVLHVRANGICGADAIAEAKVGLRAFFVCERHLPEGVQLAEGDEG